jgi:uncharacterized membrane protein YfcA
MHPATGLTAIALGGVAILYASIGHAGATGYIAVMTLCGLDPAMIRPTALVLNVIVGGITTAQFCRAGHFRRRLFVPLAIASIPCAAVAGALRLPTALFEAVVGVVLLVSAAGIMRGLPGRGGRDETPHGERPRHPALTPWPTALLSCLGGGLGLLSGLTGVGGGVFLTPVLLALTTAPVRQVAAVSAAFILVNSIAGLLGGMAAGRSIPAVGMPFVTAVTLGGGIGSQLGAFHLPSSTLRRLIAVVLVVAGLKLLMPVAG